mmetsp:Transcript_11615/g.43632  ORF Transcript_11615/g.43632 Transcript_11615/m.43632 type:complete len:162 (-) Transcript_11615:384-869(-)
MGSLKSDDRMIFAANLTSRDFHREFSPLKRHNSTSHFTQDQDEQLRSHSARELKRFPTPLPPSSHARCNIDRIISNGLSIVLQFNESCALPDNIFWSMILQLVCVRNNPASLLQNWRESPLSPTDFLSTNTFTICTISNLDDPQSCLSNQQQTLPGIHRRL